MTKRARTIESAIGAVFALFAVLFLITDHPIFAVISLVIIIAYVIAGVVSMIASPVTKVKAKLIKRPPPRKEHHDYRGTITFLLPSGKEIGFYINDYEYQSMRVGDSYIIKYTAYDLVSMKKVKALKAKTVQSASPPTSPPKQTPAIRKNLASTSTINNNHRPTSSQRNSSQHSSAKLRTPQIAGARTISPSPATTKKATPFIRKKPAPPFG